MSCVKDFFDGIAKEWSREVFDKEKLTKFLSILPIKKGDNVIDIACGTGKISEILYKMSGNTVRGIDISNEMIKNTPKISGVEFEVLDFYQESGQYDVGVVYNAFPHFLDVDKFVITSSKIIKKGGYLCILHDCSRDSLKEHHKKVPQCIYRSISSVEKEAQPFTKHFISYELIDNDNSFVMILKRK